MSRRTTITRPAKPALPAGAERRIVRGRFAAFYPIGTQLTEQRGHVDSWRHWRCTRTTLWTNRGDIDGPKTWVLW